MSAKTACPQADDLKRLVTGHLPPEQMETLAEHLESCADCVAAVKTLSAADTLVDAVARASTVEPGAEEPVVTQLISRLMNLKTAAPAASPKVTFACAGCGKKIKAKAELAGKNVKCPGCGATMPVPAPPAVADQQTLATLAPAAGDVGDAPTLGPNPNLSGADDKATQAPEEDSPNTVDDEASEKWDFLAPAERPDEIGRLGRYRILKVLGAGGMGVVFRAEDPDLERPVALKAMLPALAASPSAKKRFLREAKAAAALKHDHVVAIYQVGEDRGAPFLAMEFLDGEPLDKCLHREGKLPVAETLRIGREIAEGLAAAHGKGLIHRDIKPGNIWLETVASGQWSVARKNPSSLATDHWPLTTSRVKILDFGLARTVGDQAGLTQSGAIVGTPAYMAPEQASGKPVDHRCDLFSLGCVLYRMCTGETPFKGSDTLSMLSSLAMDNPKTPLELEPTLPEGLSELIMQLLAKKAEERLSSAHEVIESLRTLEADLADSDTQVPAGKAKRKSAGKTRAMAKPQTMVAPPRERSRTLAAVVAAGLLGFSALLGGIIYIVTDNGTIEIKTLEKDFKIVVEQDGKTVAILDPASKQTWIVNTGKYTLKLDGNSAGLEIDLPQDRTFVMKRGDKQIVSIRKVPDALAKAGPGKEAPPNTTDPPLDLSPLDKLDAEAIPASERFPWQPKELVAVLGEHRGRFWGSIAQLSFSHDGNTIACSGACSPVLFDAHTLYEKAVFAGMRAGRFTPDGKSLVTADSADEGGQWLWDMNGPEPKKRFQLTADSRNRLAFSRDGKTMAETGPWPSPWVRLWDLAGNKPKERFHMKEVKGAVGGFALAPDGKTLALGQGKTVRLWDVAGDQPREGEVIQLKVEERGLAFAPNGTLAIDGGGEIPIRLWDIKGAKPAERMVIDANGYGGASNPAFAPDGKTLGCTADINGHRLALFDLSAGKPVERARMAGMWAFGGNTIAFSPDSKTLATGGNETNRVLLWDLTEKKPQLRLPLQGGHTGPLAGAVLAPDGKTLATFSRRNDSVIRLWDLSGTVPRERPAALARGDIGRIAFAPDGKTLVVSSWWYPALVQLFDLTTEQPTESMKFTVAPMVEGISFLPNSKTVAFSGGGSIFLWDLSGDEPKELFVLKDSGAPWVLTPDGKTLVCTVPGKLDVRIWDLGGAKPRDQGMLEPKAPHKHGHANSPALFALFPDRKTLAVVASRDGAVGAGLLLWDLSGAKPKETGFLALGLDGICAVACAPDGKSVVAGTRSGQLVWWDAEKSLGLRKWTLPDGQWDAVLAPQLAKKVTRGAWRLPGPVTGLSFAPDGRHLITANANGTAYVLRLAPPPGATTTPTPIKQPDVVKQSDPPKKPATPFDQLDPEQIPKSERFPGQPDELVAVFGDSRQRHWGPVSDMVLSPDGKLLATVSQYDRMVRLWDPETLQAIGELDSNTEYGFGGLSFSEDGQWLSAWRPAGILIWDLTKKPWRVGKFAGNSGGNGAVRFLPGKAPLLVSMDSFGSLALWDASVNPLKFIKAPVKQNGLGPMFVAPGGKLIAGSSWIENVVTLWRPSRTDIKEVAKFKATAHAFSADGKLLFTGDFAEKCLVVWDVSGDQPKEIGKATHPAWSPGILRIACSRSGTRLAVATQDGFSICGLKDGVVEPFFDTASPHGQIRTLTFGTPEQGLFVGNHWGTVQRYKIGAKEATPLNKTPMAVFGDSTQARNLLSRTGRLAMWTPGGVQVWGVHGPGVKMLGETAPPGQAFNFASVVISPDGDFLTCVQGSGTGTQMESWDLRGDGSPRLAEKFLPGADTWRSFGLPDGQTLAGTCVGGRLHLVRRQGAKLKGLGKFHVADDWFRAECSRDGKTLATWVGPWNGSDVRVWNLSGGELTEIVNFKARDSHGIALSPDGKTLACSGSPPSLYDLSVNPPKETPLRDLGHTRRVCFSPDGKTLAGCTDTWPIVFLWDVATGKKRREFQLTGSVIDVVFTDDGRHLITLNYNGTAYVLRLAPPPGAKIEPAVKEAPPIPKTVSPGESPLDKLDAKAIPASERFPWQPKELVAVMGEHRQRLWAHPSNLRFAPDGKRLIACTWSQDSLLHFFDPNTLLEEPAFTVFDERAQVYHTAVDAQRKRLAFAAVTGKPTFFVGLLDMTGPQPKHLGKVEAPGKAHSLACSPDGKTLAGSLGWGGAPESLLLWDVSDPAKPKQKSRVEGCGWPVFAPDGKTIACRTEKQPYAVRLFDVTGKAPKEKAGLPFKDVCTQIAFLPDGRLVTGTADNTLRLWDVSGPKPVEKGVAKTEVQNLAVSPAGNALATLSENSTRITLWSTAGDQLQKGLDFRVDGIYAEVHVMTFSPEGRTLYTGSLNGAIRAWDVSGTQAKEKTPCRMDRSYRFHLVPSPDGRAVACFSNHDFSRNCTRLWNLTGAAPKEIEMPPEVSTAPENRPQAFTLDGRRVISCGYGGAGQIWGLTADLAPELMSAVLPASYAAAVSPDGKTLALAEATGRLRLWDIGGAKPRERVTVAEPSGFILYLVFTPDGKSLVAGVRNDNIDVVRVYDVEGPKPVERYHSKLGDGMATAALAPDGKTLAICGSMLTFWGIGSDKLEQQGYLDGVGFPTSVAYSPDGKSLAVSDNNGNVMVWDPERRVKRWSCTLPGIVQRIALAADSRHMLTLNANGTIYVLRLAPPPSKAAAKETSAESAPNPTSGSFPRLDPAWLKAVAGMKPQEQAAEVKAELTRRNPGFDGEFKPKIENTELVELRLSGRIKDLTALQALPELRSLSCRDGPLTDLSPLRGLPLTNLDCVGTQVSDLRPLKGMKLIYLWCWHTPLTDLSPVRDLPYLKHLRTGESPFLSDLTPLEGLKLTWLSFGTTAVKDLAPLRGMPLEWLDCRDTPVTDLSPLMGMPLKEINCNGIKATKLTPLKGLPLENLQMNGVPVTDLSPLAGMPLTSLGCSGCSMVSDLMPLKGLKLQFLGVAGTKVADLSLLADMPLQHLYCDSSQLERTAKILRSIKTLETINGKAAKQVLGAAPTPPR